MKKIFSLCALVIVLILGNSALAATYQLDFVLELQNRAPFKGKVITNEGQPAKISTDTVSVQLVPTKESEGIIRIKAEIWENDKAASHVENATLITRLNQSAKISENTKRGAQVFSLAVTPSQVQ